MEFKLEEFVKDYLEALKSLDSDKIMKLIDSLESDEQKIEALAGVITALEADKELIENNPKMLETLEFVKGVIAQRKEAKEDNTTKAEAVVEAPSITTTDTEE